MAPRPGCQPRHQCPGLPARRYVGKGQQGQAARVARSRGTALSLDGLSLRRWRPRRRLGPCVGVGSPGPGVPTTRSTCDGGGVDGGGGGGGSDGDGGGGEHKTPTVDSHTQCHSGAGQASARLSIAVCVLPQSLLGFGVCSRFCPAIGTATEAGGVNIGGEQW
jgi:hypothetical protein